MDGSRAYSGPFRRLFTDNTIIGTPYLLSFGFVEVRDGDRVLAILRQGDFVGVEAMIPNGWPPDVSYFAVGGATLELLDATRASMAMTSTIFHLQRWLKISALPAEDRVRMTLGELAGVQPLRISMATLGRICGVSRVWAGKVVGKLVDGGGLHRLGRSLTFTAPTEVPSESHAAVAGVH